jgi:hypothetical protein
MLLDGMSFHFFYKTNMLLMASFLGRHNNIFLTTGYGQAVQLFIFLIKLFDVICVYVPITHYISVQHMLLAAWISQLSLF